jgi:hypothetical protein
MWKTLEQEAAWPGGTVACVHRSVHGTLALGASWREATSVWGHLGVWLPLCVGRGVFGMRLPLTGHLGVRIPRCEGSYGVRLPWHVGDLCFQGAYSKVRGGRGETPWCGGHLGIRLP